MYSVYKVDYRERTAPKKIVVPLTTRGEGVNASGPSINSIPSPVLGEKIFIDGLQGLAGLITRHSTTLD